MASTTPHGNADVNSDAATTETEAAATSEMFVFTAAKAGMKDVDKQRVQEVVHKMSKDSNFYQKSLRDNEKVDQQVAAMREKLAMLTNAQQLRLQQEADARVAQLEATRDLSRTVVVVDMDMFYAAVEMRDNPKLRDIPLAVGGLNMISTTNYAARKHGVRAAMPGFIGKELCPELHFVPVDMAKYQRVANEIRAVFAEYDPDFEAFSLDEACLDLTEFVAKNWHQYAADAGISVEDESKDGLEEGDSGVEEKLTTARREAIASAIVREIRQKIFEHMNKPNGQYTLPFTRESVLDFIRDLPVRKIGGVGKVMEKKLKEALDVHTGGDLFAQRGKVFHVFTEKTAIWLLQTSLAAREERERTERKSFSRERTFRSLSDPQELEAKCKEICTMLAKDLEKKDKAAKNVAVVFKNTDFARSSRSVSLASAVFTADDLFANAVELLRRELPLTLRLMGVRASSLVSRRHDTSTTGGGVISAQDAKSADNRRRQLVIQEFTEHTTGSAVDRSAINAASSTDRNAMKGFLSTGDSDSDTNMKKDQFYPCPICNTLLNARNNLSVNTHMDACVLETKPPTSLTSSPVRRIIRKKKSSNVPLVFTTSQDSESKSDEDTKPCPICGKLLNARNNMEVNAHMDACVVRDRPSLSSRGTSKSNKRRKHENSIDVFFRKNYND
ncbi:hypothetical protein PHYBOEH_004003 [Phytophthora boehmeriae]|uniref:DNA polymerase kappa n=1 Tax=Phytophthora boehmeriae TaxID=109152 RepID=A0A8T1WMY1_9STRA|nr:hypothetical protein PHYBOEH_004003 [Phytophthora boehmeriae]